MIKLGKGLLKHTGKKFKHTIHNRMNNQHEERLRVAKGLLVTWCRNYENDEAFRYSKDLKDKVDGYYPDNFPLYWRGNYGVHKDLPFYNTRDNFYFECSQDLKEFLSHEEHAHVSEMEDISVLFEPDYDKVLLFTPDITIFCKGWAAIMIYITGKCRPYIKYNELVELHQWHNNYDPSIYVVTEASILSFAPTFKELDFHKEFRGIQAALKYRK